MYTTNDLYLAAALQEAGHPLKEVWRVGTRANFGFQDGPELQDAMRSYFAGTLQVPAHMFAERIRSAKSMAMNAAARAEDDCNA